MNLNLFFFMIDSLMLHEHLQISVKLKRILKSSQQLLN